MTDAPDPSPITQWLRRAALGDRAALDAVYASLYPDLKRLARARLRGQGRGPSMDTTMLVHESFMRLAAAHDLQLQDRRHFFAYAAKAMRHIVIDAARAQLAERHGGGAEHVTLSHSDDAGIAGAAPSDELLQVDGALRQLESLDPELAELVEMRYFGGYADAEMAELLQVSERTIRRRWEKARVWLYVALGGAG